MNDLARHSMDEFLDTLASAAPAPGGGSAAALAGAMGSALGAMVCALTIGKKKFLEQAERLERVQSALNGYRHALLRAVDSDAQAFDRVSQAYKLPKEGEDAVESRRAAIQEALVGAARSPLEMLAHIQEASRALIELCGGFNRNAASDLGVAGALLRAAAEGAYLNVMINIASIEDASRASPLRSEAESRRASVLSDMDALAERVQGSAM